MGNVGVDKVSLQQGDTLLAQLLRKKLGTQQQRLTKFIICG